MARVLSLDVQILRHRRRQRAIRAQVREETINGETLLATDYLNHFNEIVMTLEMVADMPELLEETREWRPKSYAAHFGGSGLSIGPLAIEAYRYAPMRYRRPFDATIARMGRVVVRTIRRLEALAAGGDTDALRDAATGGVEMLKQLTAQASDIIHGGTATMDQSNIDALLGSGACVAVKH